MHCIDHYDLEVNGMPLHFTFSDDLFIVAITQSTSASDADLPPTSLQEWLVRRKGGHRGTQFGLKSLWSGGDYNQFLPLVYMVHREHPWLLSAFYYRDLHMTLGLNVTKELSVNTSVTVMGVDPRSNKKQPTTGLRPSASSNFFRDLAKDLSVTKASFEVEYCKEGNFDAEFAFHYLPVPEIDCSAALTFTKILTRNLSVGASGVVLKSGKHLSYYGFMGTRQQYRNVIMSQVLDKNLSFRWSALYRNDAARRRAERDSKEVKPGGPIEEIKEWGITPACGMSLGLAVKHFRMNGGVRIENDNTQVNATLSIEKSPETNSMLLGGISFMQRYQNLYVGVTYDAGGEAPLNTLWARRTSRFGLRVSYNV